MSEQPLMNTYGRLPIALERGEGPWLFDKDGARYLDTFSGIAVCGLGHAHPAVTEAVAHQASQLVHCSNLFHTAGQHYLAKKLCELSGMDNVFFGNSGAEANEAAIKLARLWGHNRGITEPAIVVMEGAFHGRTMATLTATASRKAQAGFEPLVKGFIRVPFNDIQALRNVAANNPNVVAVMFEPVQGEGGIRLADHEWMASVRDLCDQQNWLMVLDEIQSGNGRTGHFFAYQGYGVTPDIVTTAKGLANGLPIGACLARGKAANVFQPGHHGSTFGGNPVACAAAMAVLNVIEEHDLLERASYLGQRILENLKTEFAGAHYIREIRGSGLMIGIEMSAPCQELVPLAKTQGLLMNVTSENVIRLLPALTLTDGMADEMTHQIVRVIKLYAGDDRRKPRPVADDHS